MPAAPAPASAPDALPKKKSWVPKRGKVGIAQISQTMATHFEPYHCAARRHALQDADPEGVAQAGTEAGGFNYDMRNVICKMDDVPR